MHPVIIHPSRSRPEKSIETFKKWMNNADGKVEFILSLDEDEPTDDPITKASRYITHYTAVMFTYGFEYKIISSKNRSAVDAINNAAKIATGDIFIVVSDDTDCFPGWDTALLKELEGKHDYLLKTDDGIQDYIVTMTVMDRKYYERDGFIYHPDFRHLFADTYLTCLADIRGRLLFSKLKFRHLHYSYSAGKEAPDELHKRNDGTWQDGEKTFISLMRQAGDVRKIKDVSMQNWLRNHGVR